MEEPWRIRHVRSLLAVAILFAVISAVLLIGIFLYARGYPGPDEYDTNELITNIIILSIVCMSTSFIAVLFYSFYKPVAKFVEVINALDKDLLGVWLIGRVLACTTLRHGDFSLYYFGGSDKRSAYYKLWITTMKPVPVPMPPKRDYGWLWNMLLRPPMRHPWSVPLSGNRVVVWTSSRWLWRRKTSDMGLPANVNEMYINTIKSLQRIQYEIVEGEMRIAAIINDFWLYSETQDILRTLEVLRVIEEGL